MLKAALDRNGRTKIPLSEELGYVDAYLYIIRERLGEGFRVHKDIDESILARLYPGWFCSRWWKTRWSMTSPPTGAAICG